MTLYFVKYMKNIHFKNHDNRLKDLAVIMYGQSLRQNAEHDQKTEPSLCLLNNSLSNNSLVIKNDN